MISLVDDFNEIIPLWKEAFGDSKEDIIFFTDNVRNAECIAYYTENGIASMMFLVDCKVGEENAKYIYAACTYRKYKGQGYMSELLRYVADRLTKDYKLCLIPAGDPLIEFYGKRGFEIKVPVESIEFSQIPEIKEYLLEGFELTVPCALVYKGE